MNLRVTAEHIAEGRRGDPCNCPIALAVREQLGADVVMVDMLHVAAMTIDGRDVEATLPLAASHFVDAFDHDHPVEPFEFPVTWLPGTGALPAPLTPVVGDVCYCTGGVGPHPYHGTARP